jgi:hypothetical protein
MQKTRRFFQSFCCASLTLVAIITPIRGEERKWSKEAQAVLNAPLKVAVKPLDQGPRAGSLVDFSVELQNGKSQPAVTQSDAHVELQLLDLSGAVVQSGKCKILAKEANGKCTLQAPKSGVYKLRAMPQNRELTEGTGYILVRPEAGSPQKDGGSKRQEVPKKQEPASKSPGAWIDGPGRRGWHNPDAGGVQLLNVAYFSDDTGLQLAPAAAEGCNKSRGAAAVVVLINEGGEAGGAFRAGLESATIQAFFEAEDGGSAPSDILVWLSPDHGALDHQPLVIPKCSTSGEAHLSSKYPVQTSVAYNVAPGTYPVKGPTHLQALFVHPIVGLGIVPEGNQTLSLIDRGRIVASFFDADGNTIPTDLDRTVKFVSNNSFFSTKEQSVSLKPGDFSAETVLLPFWVGSGSIFVTADRLKTAIHQVEVVGMAVILVCLSGGLFGALVLYLTSGGSLYSRLIVGIAAGIVLTWAYVFGILPKVDATIAHNYISVFVVSILGGYLGIKAFDKVISLLGW